MMNTDYTKKKIKSKNFDYTKIPDEDTIFNFLKSIYNVGQLSPECGIMAMAYIDRLLSYTGISFVALTWRRIVLGCLILASKVWEELAVWNVDFVDVFSNLTVKDLNQLERQVLNGLQFNVTLKSSVYAKYYFEIRSFAKRNAKNFPLKPLDKAGSKRLEERSKGIEEKEKKRRMSRSKSAENWVAPTVPVSLS